MSITQCESFDGMSNTRCCFHSGHSGDHLYSHVDESDAIRWRLAADERDSLRSALHLAEARIASAEKERDEAKAAADTPARIIAEQLANKDVTPMVIAGYEMIQAAVTALMCNADHDAPRNYVEITLDGMLAPFDRAAVCLIRPDGKTPHEVRLLADADRSSALSQRDRWHSEAKRIGDNYEQAVRDLDAQRRENGRLMALVGQAMNESVRARWVLDAARAWLKSRDHIRVDLWSARECDLLRALAEYDAATTKPEAGE